MGAEGTTGNRRIDKILAEDFLVGLRDVSLAEVRVMRTDAEQEEVDLSYLRRMVQGRVDVLRAEQARRSGAEGDLVAGLAKILAADEPRLPARGLGRFSTVEPSRVSSRRRYLEALVSDVDLSNVAERTDEDLVVALETLTVEERNLSDHRRQVQGVMDVLSAEITRRYRDGEAAVDALLRTGPGATGSDEG